MSLRYLEDMETPTAEAAEAAGGAAQLAASEDLPVERLAFALGDGAGKIGVLAVQGRKVGMQYPAFLPVLADRHVRVCHPASQASIPI